MWNFNMKWFVFVVNFSLQIWICNSVLQVKISDEFSIEKALASTSCASDPFITSNLNCEKSVINEAVCKYETTPQTWKEGCDLATFYNKSPTNSSSSTYWYPAKRNVEFGPYEFALWGPIYGRNIEDKIKVFRENLDDSFTKDCLVKDAATELVVPDRCEATHKRNCTVTEAELVSFCYFLNNNNCTVDKKCLKTFNVCAYPTEMVLSFDRRLRLTVYYPQCLINKGDPDYVYCVTDASDELKKRVDLRVIFNNTGSNFVVYELELEEYIGSYWCEAKASNSSSVYRSNVAIAFEHDKGNEFAVRLIIDEICNFTDCNTENNITFLIDDIKNPIEKINFGKVRVMKVNEFHTNSFADIIIHVSTFSKKPGILGDFYKLQGLINGYPKHIRVKYCRSSAQCLPEFYRNLNWPAARLFQTVLPRELCVDKTGFPLTRFCGGDFISGLNWSEVNGECFDDHVFADSTILLQDILLNQNISSDLIENVSEIVLNENLTLIDLYYVGQILDKSVSEVSCLNSSLNVVSGLSSKDYWLLSEAQERLNVTDVFLRAMENIALNLTTIATLHKDNVIFHSFNPIIQNASGFVLYKNHSIKNIPLMSNFSSIEDATDIKLALHIPNKDIQTIITSNLTNASIVAVIYLNDRLFPSNTSNISADLVVNLNIPNYESYLQSPVNLLVSSEVNTGFNCAFWDYGNYHEQKRGNWSFSGSTYDGAFSNLQICSYSHLTHLALLVLDKQDDINGTNDYILSVITALGSFLSFFSILGIFVTSCLFRSWRDKAGTQILLHLSIATLLEIVFMYMNGVHVFDCVIAGCILQYVIMSKFAWMLVYAFCQYLRFVKVFGPIPNHFILKSVVFGWGFGLIPTVTILLSNPSTYHRDHFCYPNGNYLFLGFYLPIAIVLVINLFVFCKIMCEVTSSKLDKVRSADLRTQHIKLAILLFSVLGIPWIFGLISNLIPFAWLKLIFVYIFTFTSILQGFLMFLFYVIFNKETRESWKKILCRQKKSYEIFSSKKTNSVSSIS